MAPVRYEPCPPLLPLLRRLPHRALAPLCLTMMKHMLAFLPTGLVAADPETASTR
eukprot:COSAG06_NODE_3435_length_5352_cov_14.717685_6_plen_55_part_00